MTEIAPQVLDEAARWHARLAAPDCTEFDRAGYQRWRRENTVHAQADSAAARISVDIDYLVATDPRMSVLAEEALDAGRQVSKRKRRWLLPAAIAASLALEGVALYAWLRSPLSEPEPITLTTAARERGDVTLGDGSKVHIDVSSNLAVHMTRSERTVDLKEGRALFEVAHDPSRPFAVRAGNGRITALGTRFQVQRDGNRVTVTLVEGSVMVGQQAAAGSLHEEHLTPGDEVTYSTDGSYWSKRTVDSTAVTSWSSGRLIFRGAPIAEALAEINRYAARKIRLGDSSLDRLAISGTFAIGDTASIANALTQILPLRVVDDKQNEIILLPPISPAPHHAPRG